MSNEKKKIFLIIYHECKHFLKMMKYNNIINDE